MFRSILVPLDGSAFSEYALQVALPLARAFGAVIHLVHVRRDLSWLALTDESRDPERLYLSSVATRLRDAGVEVRDTLLEDEIGDVMPAGRPFGIVATILSEYMQQHPVDLAVLTTHGRGGFRRSWLGSVTDSLVRHARVPVLTVRPPRRHAPPDERPEHPFRCITVPLDGSTTAEVALEPAIEIARATGSHLYLIRVVEPLVQPANPYVHWVLPPPGAMLRSQREIAQKYLEGLADRLRTRVRSIGYDVITGAAAPTILRAAHRQESDMIVMATHGIGGAARLFLGSVADRVIRTSDVPVLAIRAPATASDVPGSAIGIAADDVLAELGVPAYGADRQPTGGHAARSQP